MSQQAESARPPGTPKGCDWCWLLTESFRLSISSRCLGLALAGILAMTLGWKVVGGLVLSVPNGDSEAETDAAYQAVVAAWPNGMQQIDLPDALSALLPVTRSNFVPIEPVRGVAWRLAEPFRRIFSIGRSWTSLTYYACGGLVSLAVWALVGGAITRMAVVRLGLRRSIAAREAIEFGLRRWVAFFLAPLLPLIGIGMLALPFGVLGWVMRFDLGVVFAGIIWAGVLLAGLLMTILALGLAFGWPLMWGTISAENSDAFDAISRSFAYTFQRPLHYLFYAAAASILGGLGWLLAWWFAESVVSLSFWAVSLGCDGARIQQLRSLVDRTATSADVAYAVWIGAMPMRVAVDLVRSAASAFSFSYFWCVAGAIFLLLRRDTDQTQLDDVTPGPAR